MKLPIISGKLRHTFIEGWLYWYTAFGISAEAYLSTDDAYKYVNVYFLFWVKFVLTTTIAGFNALKAFRSMTFGRNYGEPNPPSTTVTLPITQPTPTVKTEIKQQ